MARSVWMARVFEILATSGPHPIDTLVAEAGGLIPPGLAFRNREAVRNWHRGYRGSGETAAEVTDEAIWSGRRRMIVHSLWSAQRDGLIAMYDRDGKKWARFIRDPRPPPTAQGLAALATRDAADRSSATKKAWQTRRKLGYRQPPMSDEQKARLRAANAAMSFEQRSARSKKGWATRRQHGGA